MATLALYAAGAAIGGPIGGTVLGLSSAAVGGAIGGIVGGLVDNTLIFPALFGQKTGTGPQLTELNVSGSEGVPMPWLLGDRAPTDGQIIDLGEILKEEEETSAGKGGASATNTKYFMSVVAVAWGHTYPGSMNKMLFAWANGKMIYDGTSWDEGVLQSAYMYYGSEEQTPNSLLETLHGGVGTVPAYRGTCYSVIGKLALAPFGNALPQFRALFECQHGISVREAILRIHESRGIPREKVDVSRIDSCFRGITISGPIPGNQLLEAIMVAYRIVRRESNGKIVFRHRGDEDVVVIDADDLGAAPDGEEVPALEVTDSGIATLPTHATVNFVDPDAEGQRGSVSDRRASGSLNVRTINLPLVISSVRAKRIARQELFRELVERKRARFTLPPRYIHLEENDIAQIAYKGRNYMVRVTQIERGANWQYVCEGVLVENQVWKSAVRSDVSTATGETVYTAPALTWQPMDLPPLVNDHCTVFGFYSAIAAELPAAKWRGANLYGSPDDLAWSLVGARANESIIGKATSTLAAAPLGLWDRGNSVTVEMQEGELASVTEAEVLNGSNWMLLGDEIIGFATATLTGTAGDGSKQYTLSTLARGLRDTGAAVGSHATNERAVLLTTTSVDFNASSYTLLGTARKLRAVPAGATVESQTSKTLTLSGRTLRPFAPCVIRGLRDVSNNLSVTWQRRSRAITRLFQAAPALDDQRVYDVVVKLAGSPVRTERVTDETWSYSAADQTLDGITPGDPIDIEIYQISAAVGRGNAGTATI